MGSRLLFEGLSFGVFENEKIALTGPNGAGKSTLLKIIAGTDVPDSGDVSYKKSLKIAFVKQEAQFPEESTIHSFVKGHLISQRKMNELDADVQASIALSVVGFEDMDTKISILSGGWRKRLAIGCAIAEEPDLLILDEPTNHMDWDGILWLEGWLKAFKKSIILVSHDRSFLNNSTNRTIEINALYRDGYLSFNCSYNDFLIKKEEYIQSQMSLQESMSNKARREVEWLRAGVKARTTKSSSRIKEAHKLLDNLQNVKERNRSVNMKSRLEIDSSGRKTKKLIEIKDFSLSFGENCLIKDLNLLLGPKKCLGLLGDNGTGKSSLLKAIVGSLNNYTGTIEKADKLQITYFDQKRDSLPQDQTLVEFLGDGSDYAIFKGQSIHVASYASRFLFTSDKMSLSISQLSGGEQARLLIAKLLLQPSDVLILDEPTNDLDITTIEILEESLKNFEGLVLIVSHDRSFLSQLCDRYLALTGKGDWTIYSDVLQWLKLRGKEDKSKEVEFTVKKEKPKKKQVKLSYKDKRRLETIEDEIATAEESLEKYKAELEKPEVFSDYEKMNEVSQEMNKVQSKVEELYSLWAELTEKSQM